MVGQIAIAALEFTFLFTAYRAWKRNRIHPMRDATGENST